MDQLCYWHDDVVLYKHALSIASFNPLIYNNLAVSFIQEGNLAEAEVQCRLAVTLFPRYADAHYTLGNIYMAKNKYAEAERQYRMAIALSLNSFQVHNNLANALKHQKKLPEAEMEYLKAIAINPGFAELRRNYSVMLCDEERYGDAVVQFREYFRLNPDPYAEFLLAKSLESAGQPDEAVVHYRNILKTDPESVATRFELAATLSFLGQSAEAVDHYREVLRLQPQHIGALQNLAWIRAANSQPQLRNGDEAVKLALQACELTGYKVADKLDVLACAYAEANRFDEAVKTAGTAIQNARDQQQESIIPKLSEHLEQFKAGKPIRY
jgi:tetratricopeptide (TPR) repeat protein